MGKSYRFPLSDQDDYKAKILFRTLVSDPTQMEFVQANRRQSSGNIFNNWVDTLLNNLVSNLNAQYGLEGDSCMLYMPAALQFQDGVNFENAQLGASGVAGLKAFNDAEGTANQVMATAAAVTGFGNEGGIDRMIAAAKGNKDVGAALAAKLASAVPGDAAGNVVSNALRTTTNPNTRATFKTVNHREHSFSFKFLPRNKAEADEIVKIIKYFRSELYPENINLGGISVGYKFPNPFAMQMLYNGNQIGQKLLPSYLKNVSTTYNGTSQSFYKDGSFSEVDLNLSFVEYRTMSKADITYDLDPLGGNNKEWWETFLQKQVEYEGSTYDEVPF